MDSHNQKILQTTGDTLKKRYFYKLFTNFAGVFVSVIIQSIIPRGMGPKAYGDFNFLNNFFGQIITFCDTGTSFGFYTKLSQRQKEHALVTFYLYFMLCVLFLVVAFMLAAQAFGIQHAIWPGQEMLYVYLAVFLVILNWGNRILSQTLDAYGLTVSSEKTKLLQKFLGLFLIIPIYFYCNLTLLKFFYFNYILTLFLIYFFCRIIKYHLGNVGVRLKISSPQVKKYIGEFYHYSHPLLVFSLVGMVAGIFDKWILQVYGGSIQQGFFALSDQIGVFCTILTTSMVPLIMREFSIAHADNDIKSMAETFTRHLPPLYLITAFFASFVVFNARQVTAMIGGQKFNQAAIVVAIMAFASINQTYGQLGGSLFYATAQTRLYRNIGVVFMLAGLPITYFLIAPCERLGLNAGAAGLAIKNVVMNYVSVGTMLYFNAKFLKLSFWRLIWPQLTSVIFLLFCSLTATSIVGNLPVLCFNLLVYLFSTALIYTIISATAIYFFPGFFGLKKGLHKYLTTP